MFQAVERRVQRTLFDQEGALGDLLDAPWTYLNQSDRAWMMLRYRGPANPLFNN